jgi:hypothetical protein
MVLGPHSDHSLRSSQSHPHSYYTSRVYIRERSRHPLVFQRGPDGLRRTVGIILEDLIMYSEPAGDVNRLGELGEETQPG